MQISNAENTAFLECREVDGLLKRLNSKKSEWADLDVHSRIRLLEQIRDSIPGEAERWIARSSQAKGIAPDSPLEGEEWMSGPYALLGTCNKLLRTLNEIAANGSPDIGQLRIRETSSGQISVEIFPLNLFDKLLLGGVRAEVWMQPGIDSANLAQNIASTYRRLAPGELALILGAGNVSSIAPLDAFHKLFTARAVAIVKLNPVNEYLLPVFQRIFKPLLDKDYMHIVKGGGELGAYLCQHELVDSIHITGSQETHDAIVFGRGAEGAANRAGNRPINARPISSELGAVCPTIVVPGPWSPADIRFQAAHIATQKLNNSGFNCVACQILLLPQAWEHTETLRAAVQMCMAQALDRIPYYPGAAERQTALSRHYAQARRVNDKGMFAQRMFISLSATDDGYACHHEVFAPTLCERTIAGDDAESLLRNAIRFANEQLHGTLGANILIHPTTMKLLGRRFDELLSELHYGCIAVNAWCGVGFLLTQLPWGAFPGHRLDDVQSGIGFVHNTFMFDRPERSVVYAPFTPFPRNLLSGAFNLLPKPPWFVSHRRAQRIGRRLVDFEAHPSWFKLPGIFIDACLG